MHNICAQLLAMHTYAHMHTHTHWHTVV